MTYAKMAFIKAEKARNMTALHNRQREDKIEKLKREHEATKEAKLREYKNVWVSHEYWMDEGD